MSEPIAKRQIFEYDSDKPFHIYNPENHEGNDSLLFNHWHEELEIVYVIHGHSRHYIDGSCIESGPGRLIVVNSESIHNIIPDKNNSSSLDKVVVVLIISREFLEQIFPDFRSMYFLNEKQTTLPEIRDLMLKLSDYEDGTACSGYEKIYIRGLVLQLLYHICQEGVAEREAILPINNQKNIERMKGVFQYLE